MSSRSSSSSLTISTGSSAVIPCTSTCRPQTLTIVTRPGGAGHEWGADRAYTPLNPHSGRHLPPPYPHHPSALPPGASPRTHRTSTLPPTHHTRPYPYQSTSRHNTSRQSTSGRPCDMPGGGFEVREQHAPMKYVRVLGQATLPRAVPRSGNTPRGGHLPASQQRAWQAGEEGGCSMLQVCVVRGGGCREG